MRAKVWSLLATLLARPRVRPWINSSGNSPWMNAKEAAEDFMASKRAGQPPDDSRSAALQDLAYCDGARQALVMAHQSLSAADEWLAGGCGNRSKPARSELTREHGQSEATNAAAPPSSSRDSERLDFVLSAGAFVVAEMGLGRVFQIWSQDEDENFHIMSGGEKDWFASERDAIDAAMERDAVTKTADQLATEDAMHHGSGFVRVMPDGSREHVPHHDVWIEPSDEKSWSEPAEHCQNGGDVCLAGNKDGICCPDDSCDIDDRITKRDPRRAAPETGASRDV